jgi:hypothetical protein
MLTFKKQKKTTKNIFACGPPRHMSKKLTPMTDQFWTGGLGKIDGCFCPTAD